MRFGYLIWLWGFVTLTGCANSNWPSPDASPYELASVQSQFDKASIKPLGSKADMIEIKKAILSYRGEPSVNYVGELRWLSPTQVMAKCALLNGNVGSSGYTYVLEKRSGIWKVIVVYMDWIS